MTTVTTLKNQYDTITTQSRLSGNKDTTLIPQMESLRDEIKNFPDYQNYTNPDLSYYIKDLDNYILLIKNNTQSIQKVPAVAKVEMSQSGKIQEVDAPKPKYQNDGPTKGNPTTPAISRSIVEGTSVQASNNNLAHVCDFVSEMQKNMQLKKFMKALADQIRKALRAILEALGFDPTGQYSWLVETLKSLAREINRIRREIIQPILDFEKYVLAYITKLRAMVQWILQLPQRFLAMLQDCLAKILKLISSIFTDTISGLMQGLAGEGTSELLQAAKQVASETLGLVQDASKAVMGAVAIPVSATAGLLVPVSQAELDAANKTITSYNASHPTIAAITSDNAAPEQNKSTP